MTDGPLGLQLLIVFLLILVNAFFAASEIAVISLNENKVRREAEEGRKKAIVRHNRMVMFLEGFFEENDVPEWGKFLQEFLSQSSKEKIAS